MTFIIPPYVANPTDHTCRQSVYQMILQHFLPEQTWGLEQANDICGAEDGKWTWRYHGFIELSKLGFQVKSYSLMDVEKLLENPRDYLASFLGTEGMEANYANCNMERVLADAKTYLELPTTRAEEIHRAFTIEDMQNSIQEGALICCWVNQCALEGKEGFYGHKVLVYGVDDENVHIHNPGYTKEGVAHAQNEAQLIPHNTFMRATTSINGGQTVGYHSIKLSR